jgi:hypothetical protein
MVDADLGQSGGVLGTRIQLTPLIPTDPQGLGSMAGHMPLVGHSPNTAHSIVR